MAQENSRTFRVLARAVSCGVALRPKPWRLLAALLFLATVLTTARAAGADRTGKLLNVDGVRVLRVWGTSQDRGFAHGYHFADEIVSLLDSFIASGGLKTGGLDFETGLIPFTKRMTVPFEYEQELMGLRAGIVARLGEPPTVAALGRKLTYDDLLAMNCIADVAAAGCSSFAAWGPLTEGGNTVAGRNLDWPRIDALFGRQVVVVYEARENPAALGWVSVTWPGLIGCYTGMNSESVTVSVHDVRGVAPMTDHGFTPRTLTLRDAIEAARAESAARDISKILSARVSLVGNNVPVAMASSVVATPPSVVFEYDGRTALDGGVTMRVAESPGYQLCTNHYVKRGEPVACRRYDAMRRRLESISAAGSYVGIGEAWSVLADAAMGGTNPGELTTYTSVIFEPDHRRMHVAFGEPGRPAPLCKRVTLDVTELLKFTVAPSRTE